MTISSPEIVQYCMEMMQEAQEEKQKSSTNSEYWQGRYDAFNAVVMHVLSAQGGPEQ